MSSWWHLSYSKKGEKKSHRARLCTYGHYTIRKKVLVAQDPQGILSRRAVTVKRAWVVRPQLLQLITQRLKRNAAGRTVWSSSLQWRIKVIVWVWSFTLWFRLKKIRQYWPRPMWLSLPWQPGRRSGVATRRAAICSQSQSIIPFISTFRESASSPKAKMYTCRLVRSSWIISCVCVCLWFQLFQRIKKVLNTKTSMTWSLVLSPTKRLTVRTAPAKDYWCPTISFGTHLFC